MRSPFLVARSVLFALLANFSVLILVFAAWNANAAISAGLPVPATTAFLILNSCFTFFFIILGLAQLMVRQANTSQLLFECCWSAGLSISQTGAAISITVNGAESCGNSSDLCASSFLLIPTSWLSTLIAFTYFFTLFFSTVAHRRVQPDIWHETVYSVAWFNDAQAFSIRSKEHSEFGSTQAKSDVESQMPSWAQQSHIRRGVDIPFKKQGTLPMPSSTSTASVDLPVAPLNAQRRDTVGSRFIEKFRDSQLITRSETPLQSGIRAMLHKDPFPLRVDNHDLPIPLPRLSEWIRADALKGINVHTVPHSP